MSCQLICPNLRCRKILKVPEEARGKVVRCQYCQTMLRVPPHRRLASPPPPDARMGGFSPPDLSELKQAG
jgi:LSD1 subclass zinc finger protein